MNNVHFSIKASVFHGRTILEEGSVEGYASIKNAYNLKVPMPDTISVISSKNRKYKKSGWNVLPLKYKPEDNLYKQLIFAFRYEGVNLLLLLKLFEKLESTEVEELINIEPSGQYSRKIWFLYEWLLNKKLELDDADTRIKYIPLLDDKLQYSIDGGIKSPRHRIVNNLPGTKDFCPLVFKTPKLEQYIKDDFKIQKTNYLKGIRKDLLQRASAFLLLKDSKASFTIEGESYKSKRTARWGKIIGQAGTKRLCKEEFLRLQQEVIENPRFVQLGFRKIGGFVGEHDRLSGEPLPDHISARGQDVETLMNALLETYKILLENETDAVIAASVIAFGFVFIHPFEDGNGRVHRYLIHHLLAEKKFTGQGMIFPISASILDHIDDYRKILESFSVPLLDFIEWKETKDHNIEVLNDTMDYYKYFDVTKQAEFLYDCVNDTIKNIIPYEVSYLIRYDEFKKYLDDGFEMPDKMVALLARFLEQNEGKISKRARSKELSQLTDDEVAQIEKFYSAIFLEK